MEKLSDKGAKEKLGVNIVNTNTGIEAGAASAARERDPHELSLNSASPIDEDAKDSLGVDSNSKESIKQSESSAISRPGDRSIPRPSNSNPRNSTRQ